MKHRTKHITSRRLILVASAIGLFLLLRFFFSGGIVAGVELNIRWVFLIIALSLGCLPAFITYYEYHGIGSQEGITRRGEKLPFVSITFDDGPDPKYTPHLLDTLKEKNVKATFFVVGKNVEKYPEIARRIVEEGHDIANHTYTHKELAPSTKNIVINEIVKADEAIKKATGVSTHLFRPPRGIYSQASRQILVDLGYKIILWSVSSVDWRNTSPTWILNRIKRFAKNGSIILFHDAGALLRKEGGDRTDTVKVMPLVIDYLQSQNYKIVPISKLLKLSETETSEAAPEKSHPDYNKA